MAWRVANHCWAKFYCGLTRSSNLGLDSGSGSGRGSVSSNKDGVARYSGNGNGSGRASGSGTDIPPTEKNPEVLKAWRKLRKRALGGTSDRDAIEFITCMHALQVP